MRNTSFQQPRLVNSTAYLLKLAVGFICLRMCLLSAAHTDPALHELVAAITKRYSLLMASLHHGQILCTQISRSRSVYNVTVNILADPSLWRRRTRNRLTDLFRSLISRESARSPDTVTSQRNARACTKCLAEAVLTARRPLAALRRLRKSRVLPTDRATASWWQHAYGCCPAPFPTT